MKSRHIIFPTLVVRKQLANIGKKSHTLNWLAIFSNTLHRAKLSA